VGVGGGFWGGGGGGVWKHLGGGGGCLGGVGGGGGGGGGGGNVGFEARRHRQGKVLGGYKKGEGKKGEDRPMGAQRYLWCAGRTPEKQDDHRGMTVANWGRRGDGYYAVKLLKFLTQEGRTLRGGGGGGRRKEFSGGGGQCTSLGVHSGQNPKAFYKKTNRLSGESSVVNTQKGRVHLLQMDPSLSETGSVKKSSGTAARTQDPNRKKPHLLTRRDRDASRQSPLLKRTVKGEWIVKKFHVRRAKGSGGKERANGDELQ